MKHIGVIAEYNPFHNGHFYQLNQIRKQFPDKRIIILMSGDFVQRGEPAIFSKSVRTSLALSGGADLVLELPSLPATSSSEYFADAGVRVLSEIGCVDTICFGAECDSPAALSDIAELLLSEPPGYRAVLKHYLASGFSFPKARAFAVNECCPNHSYSEILSQPNNILAIEYMKAIKRHHLPLSTYIVKRTGSGHNDISTDHVYCSANALRSRLHSGAKPENAALHQPITTDYSSWETHLPRDVFRTLNQSELAKPLYAEDFYPLLKYRILLEQQHLSDYHEMTKALSNKLERMNGFTKDYDSLIDFLSGKEITKARVRRALLNVLLNRTDIQAKATLNRRQLPYLRILGLRKSCSHLIREIEQYTALPLINKMTVARKQLSGAALEQFLQEVFESELYRQVFYDKYGILPPSEYEQSVIAVDK